MATVSQEIFDSPSALRIAKIAIGESHNAIEKQHALGIFDDGDPNHPKYNNGINYVTGRPLKLFGYDVDKFIARQY